MKARHGGRTTCGSLEHRDEGNASVRSLLGRWQEGFFGVPPAAGSFLLDCGGWGLGHGHGVGGERRRATGQQSETSTETETKATSKHRQASIAGDKPSGKPSGKQASSGCSSSGLYQFSSVQFGSALSAERSIWASLIQCPARLHRRLTNCPHSR